MQVQHWIHAFRLRTLPLALSSIAMGAFLAAFYNVLKWDISLLAALTTVFLQVLSNLANDYGDALKGTDNQHRVGPERAVQSGKISVMHMRRAIIVFSALSLISGIVLISHGLRGLDARVSLLFLILGLSAIASAILYTVGKKAYGYSGLGDLFVFLFFGLLAVIGTFFLNAQFLRWDIWLPAASLGFLSTGVLNLNNLRDIHNDRNSGKNTIAVRLGIESTKIYHFFLIGLGLFSALTFNLLNLKSWIALLWLIPIVPLFIIDLIKIMEIKDLKLLDPYLKKLALKTLLFVLLFGICLVWS
ncbi:MAG: 1,4-dihydroxy-2-naphthoate polyprenyltransferase [Bacteroidales bacterium]|nr:1,4-dihydroxy-2-naphthoate polyprenyltransferase [Bacteroidales bacterium]